MPAPRSQCIINHRAVYISRRRAPERDPSSLCIFSMTSEVAQQEQQQTGVPFIITQQVQPAFIMPIMQSQHD